MRAVDQYTSQVMAKKVKAGQAAPKPLDSGWPIDLPYPVPQQELYADYWQERFNWESWVEDILRNKGITEAQEILNGGPERWGSWEEMESFFVSVDEAGRASRQSTVSGVAPVRGFHRPMLCNRDWRSDAEFMRARVAGAHPTALSQVRQSTRPLTEKMPDGLLIEEIEETVKAHMDGCENLADAVTQGRLYMIDHSNVLKENVAYGEKGFEWEMARGLMRKEAVMCNPVALFFRQPSGDLTPLVIQLYCAPAHPGHKDLAPSNALYYPWDPAPAWLMAKMFFNQADLHVHLIGALHTQAVMIPSLMQDIAWKQFSPHHPLRQMLRPHLRGAIGWAERWHTTLLGGEGGLLLKWLAVDYERYQDVSTKSYARWDFINDSVKHDWRQRMKEESDVPGYHYREDAMLLWDAIEEYVLAVVKRYYTKYDDIDHDVELIGWIREMSARVTRVMELHPARPWDPIVFNITNVITRCVITYSGETRGVYDWYGCVPFAPANASMPPCVEKAKEDITDDDLLRMMPDKASTLLQIATTYVLSGHADDIPTPAAPGKDAPVTTPLANTPALFGDFSKSQLFVDRSANKLAEGLRQRLDDVARRIDERNAEADVPYHVLHPSTLRNSIPPLI